MKVLGYTTIVLLLTQCTTPVPPCMDDIPPAPVIIIDQ